MTIHKHSLPVSPSGLSRTNSDENGSGSYQKSRSSLTTREPSFASLSINTPATSFTATPEFSSLVAKEVGSLLNLDDLEKDSPQTIISDTDLFNKHFQPQSILTSKHTSRSIATRGRGSFLLDIDSESEEEDDDYTSVDETELLVDDELINANTMRKVKTQDMCGAPFSQIDAVDYKTKFAIVLIGMPASGKSSLISDFISYSSEKTEGKMRVASFNAGDVRRRYESQSKNKLNFGGVDSKQLRDLYAFEALSELTNSLINDELDIGICDATNTTLDRRRAVFQRIKEASTKSGVAIQPIMLEVKCKNRALRRFNIEKKSNNHDYKNIPKTEAIQDFFKRIAEYEKVYKKVTVEEIQDLRVKYFGINNVGDDVYYDCGLQHHDNGRHQHMRFGHAALNILYDFLMSYRINFALPYLQDVESFFRDGHYQPIESIYSTPVTEEESENTSKLSVSELPKVLSSSRIYQDYC